MCQSTFNGVHQRACGLEDSVSQNDVSSQNNAWNYLKRTSWRPEITYFPKTGVHAISTIPPGICRIRTAMKNSSGGQQLGYHRTNLHAGATPLFAYCTYIDLYSDSLATVLVLVIQQSNLTLPQVWKRPETFSPQAVVIQLRQAINSPPQSRSLALEWPRHKSAA